MVARIVDWRGWIWPLMAGALVLAIAGAGVLTAPEKVETRTQKRPPDYVKQAALHISRQNGDKQPVAVEWIVAHHDEIAAAMKLHDSRPGYKRDILILVQGEFLAAPGMPPKPPGQQRSSWMAMLYTAGKSHQQLAVIGAYAQRPDTKGLRPLKRFDW